MEKYPPPAPEAIPPLLWGQVVPEDKTTKLELKKWYILWGQVRSLFAFAPLLSFNLPSLSFLLFYECPPT